MVCILFCWKCVGVKLDYKKGYTHMSHFADWFYFSLRRKNRNVSWFGLKQYGIFFKQCHDSSWSTIQFQNTREIFRIKHEFFGVMECNLMCGFTSAGCSAIYLFCVTKDKTRVMKVKWFLCVYMIVSLADQFCNLVWRQRRSKIQSHEIKCSVVVVLCYFGDGFTKAFGWD